MSPPAVDPVVVWTLRLALAALLAAAALHKLRAPRRFRAVLEGYALLPAGLLAPAAWGVPALEGGLAAALLHPALAAPAAAGAAGLLALYAAAIAVNLGRGRRALDCGCLGPAAAGAGLHGGLVARNAVLVAAAGLAAAPPAPRGLGALDLFTVAAACAFLALAWGAASGLLAHAPRLRAGAVR